MSRSNFWIIILSLTIIICSILVVGYIYFLNPQKTPARLTTPADQSAPFPTAPDRSEPLPAIKDFVNRLIPDSLFSNQSSRPLVEKDKPVRLPIDNVANFGLSKIKGQPVLLAIDQTGGIYRLDGGNVQKLATIPEGRIFDAVFAGKTYPKLVVRSFTKEEKLESSFISLNLSSTTEQGDVYSVQSRSLEQNIFEVTNNPNGNGFFVLEKTLTGSKGKIMDENFTKIKDLFVENYGQWTSSWPTAQAITLTSRPAGSVEGYGYLINSGTGRKSKIVGPVFGLETLTSDKGNTIYSSVEFGRPSPLKIIRETAPDLETSVRTTVKKCSWLDNAKIVCGVPKESSLATSIDSWYRGEESFEDDIWLIDPQKGTANILLRTKDFGLTWDTQKIVPVKGNYYLLDKKTLSLWLFKAASE